MPPFFDPDNPEENERHMKACREFKEFQAKFRADVEKFHPISDPFWLDPELRLCCHPHEYEEWQRKYMRRHQFRCDIFEGLQQRKAYKLTLRQLFPDLPENELHDLPEEVWNPEKYFFWGWKKVI